MITSIYKIDDQHRITVNLKAPLIIDNKTNYGIQYVFMNNKYSMQYEVL
ncbi:MAG: hypothetical protein EOO46_19950 [Flavobacterium sp.]|nr:MAG: hypothetical protein EOO46_19950 [Flavobacterium sp.]